MLDEDGKAVTPIMGSYGIGIERILTGAIEQNHDQSGIVLPVSIAPFQAVVTPVNIKQDAQREAADAIYAQLQAAGVDALLDDRPLRAGVKFNDADLIGVPFRVTVGRKIGDGIVEVTDRRTKASKDVRIESIVASLQQAIAEAMPVARADH